MRRNEKKNKAKNEIKDKGEHIMKKTLTEIYGSMVFDEATMQERLSAKTFAWS